ncbi:DUF2515 domain-containing protein [Anoxybacteroides rupiense]|uniref:DUF2515 domain-containing protein n=1 Tax=Anoxybacteroides rupiense TaxID=311460 RepID=UPI001605AF83|nr:DUF2515 domain-containing protein [Anoxybacillus rupiensis]MBB3908503.1 hypothetical protein [Anoxybacillus rupiensis]
MCWFKKKAPSLSPFLAAIQMELKKKKRRGNRITEQDLSAEESSLLRQIRVRTQISNVNNITRTAAYLDFYQRHREIHWAFLGHMVSRNGGWNMTDLKGEWLLALLTEEEQQAFFSFLERGNWLIFQDIYPQFLLYEESKKRGIPLFYLLPCFHVSLFMETIWNHFWRYNDPYILAIALVINEQNYLEKRVIQHPVFQKKVFEALEFKIQDFFSLNHILFPYEDEQGQTVLMGETIHHFQSLHERIMLGKRLYALLFQDNDTLERAVRWASRHPHTGTRKDYWPHLFNDVRESLPGQPYRRRIKDCQISEGEPRIYSPPLLYVWKNVEHQEAEQGDWFTDPSVVHYLAKNSEWLNGEISNAYCKTLEKLELAATAKSHLF